jgi:16S rRNA (guanine527-N7)-methyltransferase
VSEETLHRLESGLAQLGFAEPSDLAVRLAAFGRLLLEANRHTNLVGAKSLDDLVGAHLLDSLAPLAGMRLREPIVDLGSGAGLPGIPAALAWPGLYFVLLEPRAKRADFLRSAVAALGLDNVEVEKVSAETAGRGQWRDRAGTVLARALAKPEAALVLALPLLARGGRLAVYTGREAAPGEPELAAIGRLNARLVEARAVVVPYLDAQRHVWIIEKTGPTPAGVPPPARVRREDERAE